MAAKDILQKCVLLSVNHPRCEPGTVLKLGENELTTADEVSDLGIIIDSKLKFNLHINRIVAKAFNRTNLILKCFLSKDVPTLVRAFNVYVRPILEYASCVWSPHYITDINRIESVQRNFTKRLPGCALLNYKDRLQLLNMETLESRRLRQDLLMTYKILFGLVDVNANNFFTIANTGYDTRGHHYKLQANHSRVDVRKYFFAERVVHVWNSLALAATDITNLQAFVCFISLTDLSAFFNNVADFLYRPCGACYRALPWRHSPMYFTIHISIVL